MKAASNSATIPTMQHNDSLMAAYPATPIGANRDSFIKKVPSKAKAEDKPAADESYRFETIDEHEHEHKTEARVNYHERAMQNTENPNYTVSMPAAPATHTLDEAAVRGAAWKASMFVFALLATPQWFARAADGFGFGFARLRFR